MKYITMFRYNRFKKRIEWKIHPRDFELYKIMLLEEQHADDENEVYFINEKGEEQLIDYYNMEGK